MGDLYTQVPHPDGYGWNVLDKRKFTLTIETFSVQFFADQ